MENFLPDSYDIPDSSGGYMKFKEGENRFRILASPIIGWEYWITDEEGNKKPLRKRMDNPFTVAEADEPEKIKHFWAMPVYNYADKKIVILEVTQKGIQKAIKRYSSDIDWGSPLNYDLVVSRSGEGLNTEYEVIAKPAKPIDEAIIKVFQDMEINLEELYSGEDPFAKKK